jgi:hypothetical protein
MARLLAGKSIVNLGHCHGIYRGRTEGGQYRFQLLDGSGRFDYYTKKDKLWEPIQTKKLSAAELYNKGQLFIDTYVYYMDGHNIVRGKIFNTNPLELIVRGLKIEKRLDDVFTFESVTGPRHEIEALQQALSGGSASQSALQCQRGQANKRNQDAATLSDVDLLRLSELL